MAVNSGRKGSKFERNISRELSLWITDNKRNDIFWRTHSSGTLGTVSKKKSEYGDIMHIDDLGKPLTGVFNIECRHGKCIKIRDLIYKPAKSSMMQFIQEGVENARLSGRKSLWIFREQGASIMIMMSIRDLEHFVFSTDAIDTWLVSSELRVAIIKFEVWKKHFRLRS